MADHVVAKAGVFQNAFPGGADLAGDRLAIMAAVDDEPDLFAPFHEPGVAQLLAA